MNKECFKFCIVRYLHPAEHHPTRIRKIDEILADELDFENIKFLSKLKTFTRLKKIIVSTLVFLVMKIRKNKFTYQKNVMKTNLLIYQSTAFFQYFKRLSKKKILSCTVIFTL